MKTVKVLRFTEAAIKNLLRVGVDDFKGTTYISEETVKKTEQKMNNICFPCEMEITGEKDICGRRILKDPNGVKWSESHFVIED